MRILDEAIEILREEDFDDDELECTCESIPEEEFLVPGNFPLCEACLVRYK